MFGSFKRLLGSGPSRKGGQGSVLSDWAHAQGHAFKTVKDKGGGGFVVLSSSGLWRLEWGASQRSYIDGQELRFRCESTLAPDVQVLVISKVLAQALETEVYSSFTNAMQTQVDNTLPDEMRWLPMHPKVAVSGAEVLSRRFSILSNADVVTRQWLEGDLLTALEDAASGWWTDALIVVMTINRGRLTLRMMGDDLDAAQLTAVSELFEVASRSLRAVAIAQPAQS